MSILVIYGSSRKDGNSETLARTALKGVPHTEVHLMEKNILPIEDKRHDPAGFRPLGDDYDEVIQAVREHDTLVFVTPLYWYGMSGLMKNFVDRWSQSLRSPHFDFKAEMAHKQAYVVITGGDNPRLKALPLVQQFQYIFGFMGMSFAGYLIGQANAPGDIEHDARALFEAGEWNKMWQK